MSCIQIKWTLPNITAMHSITLPTQVAFLDVASTDRGLTQYSVLVRGRRHEGREWDPPELLMTQRIEEDYRIRLPQNRQAGVGPEGRSRGRQTAEMVGGI